MAYKIPASLDRSMLDFNLVIQGGGMRMKPLPLKVILFWVSLFFLLLFFTTQSWMTDSPIWLRVVFGIWLLAAGAYFGSLMKTGEFRFGMLLPLFDYLPKANRRMSTRSDDSPYKFMNLVGIKDIEEGNGLIHFMDGTYGQAYNVVGWASRLLFEGDRRAIINRVDNFYKKVEPNVEWIYVTTKEPQRVYNQIANLERQNQRLKYRDANGQLQNMLEEKYDILDVVVGGRESQYNSIHQYLIIKAKSLEALRTAHSVLAAETESARSMLKSCIMLDDEATLRMLQVLYKNDDRPRKPQTV